MLKCRFLRGEKIPGAWRALLAGRARNGFKVEFGVAGRGENDERGYGASPKSRFGAENG